MLNKSTRKNILAELSKIALELQQIPDPDTLEPFSVEFWEAKCKASYYIGRADALKSLGDNDK